MSKYMKKCENYRYKSYINIFKDKHASNSEAVF